MFFPPTDITIDAALRDLQSPKKTVRAHAARALGSADERIEDVLVALAQAAQDPAVNVRAATAHSLGDLAFSGNESGVAQILERLSQDDDEGVVIAAADALSHVGASAENLVRPLLSHAAAPVRFHAIHTLATIAPTAATDALLGALDDEDEEVVGAAALGLGACDPEPSEKPKIVAALKKALEGSRHDIVRFDIAYALASLDDASGQDELIAATRTPETVWDAVPVLISLGDRNVCAALASELPAALPPAAHHILIAKCILSLAPDSDAAAIARDVVIRGLLRRKRGIVGLAIEVASEVGGAWTTPALTRVAKGRHAKFFAEELHAASKAIAARSR